MPKMKDPEPLPPPTPLPQPQQPAPPPVVPAPAAVTPPPAPPLPPQVNQTPAVAPPPQATQNSDDTAVVKRRKSKRKELQQASSGTDALRIPLDKSIGATPSGTGGTSGLNIPR